MSTTKNAKRASRRAAPRGSARWWYTARVKNSAGMHSVFYSTTRPVVGATCPGIAAPNRITGYWREFAPKRNEDTVEPLVRHLRDLLSQWRETVMLYQTAPELREAASGYRECIAELEQILKGDLSAIEPMPNNTVSGGAGATYTPRDGSVSESKG